MNSNNILVDTHIPMKALTKTQKNNKPWITKGIRKSISNRDKLLKSSHRAKTVQEKSKFFKQYKKVRNKIVELIRLSKENYFKNYFSKNVKSPKNIWKGCLLYTSPSPRDKRQSRMPSSA